MRRRTFIAGLGGAAAWPLAVRAQQPAMPIIGLLGSAAPGPYEPNLAAIRQGLKEAGFIEGKNVAIEYRWAEGQYERLPALATELVSRQAAVIITIGGTATARAAKAATKVVPIVFAIGGDPVEDELVTTLNRPSANVTGVTFFSNSLLVLATRCLRSAWSLCASWCPKPPSSRYL